MLDSNGTLANSRFVSSIVGVGLSRERGTEVLLKYRRCDTSSIDSTSKTWRCLADWYALK